MRFSRNHQSEPADGDQSAWRTFAVSVARVQEAFVVRPQSDLGRSFIEAAGKLRAKLEKPSVRADKVVELGEALEKTAVEFATAQREEIEMLVTHLGEAVSETLHLFGDSLDNAGAVAADMNQVKRGLLDAQKADSLDETRRLLAQGVAGLQKLIEDQVSRERTLRAEYEEHAGRLNARLDQARYESRTDQLTGVANRRAFEEHADSVYKAAGLDRQPRSLAMLDLDGFKILNDTRGHAAGDAALVLFAKRLRAGVGEKAFVARLGGDEFVVLAPNPPNVLTGMLATLTKSFEDLPALYEGEALNIGFSYGVSPLDGSAAVKSVMADADAALYEYKQRRKARRAA